LDKELEQLFPPDEDHYSPRYVDKLVKVFMQNSEEKWILIHVEVQGYADKDFSKRMFQYYYRIFDQYDKHITAFAIFTDERPGFHPKDYVAEFLGTSIRYRFNTYKIIDQNNAELEASSNPFAMAVLSAKLAVAGDKMKDQELLEHAFSLAKRLLAKKIPREKIRKLMNFLRYYLRFENPEMFAKFEWEISNLTERSYTMGIEEFLLDNAKKEGLKIGLEKGREEGREEGRGEGIRETALKMKKSGLDISTIAAITGLSLYDIEELN
jgi:predicted transposase YdaD